MWFSLLNWNVSFHCHFRKKHKSREKLSENSPPIFLSVKIIAEDLSKRSETLYDLRNNLEFNFQVVSKIQNHNVLLGTKFWQPYLKWSNFKVEIKVLLIKWIVSQTTSIYFKSCLIYKLHQNFYFNIHCPSTWRHPLNNWIFELE